MRSIGLLAAGLALAQPAFGQAYTSRDLSLPQLLVQSVEQPAASPLEVSAWLDDPDGTYAVGEQVRLAVRANRDAFFEVIAIGPSGNAVRLYPNAFQQAELVAEGRALGIPDAEGKARIVVEHPLGVEFIRIVASTVLQNSAENIGEGPESPFRAIPGGAEAVARGLQLQIVGRDGEMAFADLYLRSVATETASPALSAPEALLPPLLAVDRDNYALGEQLRIAVTSFEECHLWVLNVSSDHSARVLFPNAFATENRVGAGETTIISGGAAAGQIIASGPEGIEAIHAFCSRSETPPWSEDLELPATLPDLDQARGWARELLTAAPGGAPVIGDGYSWSSRFVAVSGR